MAGPCWGRPNNSENKETQSTLTALTAFKHSDTTTIKSNSVREEYMMAQPESSHLQDTSINSNSNIVIYGDLQLLLSITTHGIIIFTTTTATIFTTNTAGD